MNFITTDKSIVVGTTAVQVYAQMPALQTPNGGLNYLRIWNVGKLDGQGGGQTVWLSRSGVAVVNGAGSFPLLPGLYEIWTPPQLIPANALSAIVAYGTAPLTVEMG